MSTRIVNVTNKIIATAQLMQAADKGLYKATRHCPIALAVKADLKPGYIVTVGGAADICIKTLSGQHVATLRSYAPQVAKLVGDFDSKMPVAPIRFEAKVDGINPFKD